MSAEGGISLDRSIFLGHAIHPGGNDYPVFELGLDIVKVRDVAEMVAVVRASLPA